MAKARSPGYPAIGLKEAIERVRMVYDHDYQNKLPKKVIVEHMGFKSLNGGSLPVLAALNKFGLLEGRGDETRVSDRALSIIAHEPGAGARLEAIKDAADEPALFAELDEKFSGGKASDAAIRSYLLTSKYLPEAADTAIRAYRETKQLVDDEAHAYAPQRQPEPTGRAESKPVQPLQELGTPPAPPRPPSARSQGMDFMVTSYPDRLVGDFEIADRETAELFIKALQRNLEGLPSRAERARGAEVKTDPYANNPDHGTFS